MKMSISIMRLGINTKKQRGNFLNISCFKDVKKCFWFEKGVYARFAFLSLTIDISFVII
jgi:hypothetical protein